MTPARWSAALPRRASEDRGQALVAVLGLVTVLFLVGTALVAQASTALRSTAANATEAAALDAADAGAELGIWWQRNGKSGNPPSTTVNGITVSTTVSTTTSTGSAGWRQWGFDPQGAGQSSSAGPSGSGSRWGSFPTLAQGSVVSSPTVTDDGYVYAGATNGLYAYQPNGQLAWSFLSTSQSPVVGAFSGSPAILTTGAGARMIVAATNGGTSTGSTVFGLTETTGHTGVSITWSYALGNGASIGFVGGARLNAAGTRAYLAAQNSTLYAFATSASGTNAPLWTAATGGSVTKPVVLNAAETRVYAASTNGIVRAYLTSTGAQQWTRTLTTSPDLTAPTFRSVSGRDHLYIGVGANGRIRAVTDLGTSSTEDWSVALAGNAFSAPVSRVSGGSSFVYVACDTGAIVKLTDAGTSVTTTWTVTPAASVTRAAPALDNAAALYIGNDAGTLYRILDNGASASTSWSRSMGLGTIRSELVVGAFGDVYAMSTNGSLIAIGPAPIASTVTVTATGGGSTVTTVYPDAGSGVPTLSSWTATR